MKVLAVDLDGTLIEGDTFYDTVKQSMFKSPITILLSLARVFGGKNLSKIYLSKKIVIDPSKLLYNQNVIDLIMDQKKRGGKVVLVSGSSILYVQKVAKYLMLFDDVMGSDEKTNLTGKVKALKLSSIYGKKEFDYIGNDFIDIEVWKNSSIAYVASSNQRLIKMLKKMALNIIL
jgi:3-deoxy-D-manno-octulosonate 8-phosphate phosphatase KdsC-like HAD superfamily phosphatase